MFTFNRNSRSPSTEISVHVEPKWVFTIDRNTHLFILRERIAGSDKQLSDALSLDDFVRLVDSMGPKKMPRIMKSEAAFMKQLAKKDNAP